MVQQQYWEAVGVEASGNDSFVRVLGGSIFHDLASWDANNYVMTVGCRVEQGARATLEGTEVRAFRLALAADSRARVAMRDVRVNGSVQGALVVEGARLIAEQSVFDMTSFKTTWPKRLQELGGRRRTLARGGCCSSLLSPLICFHNGYIWHFSMVLRRADIVRDGKMNGQWKARMDEFFPNFITPVGMDTPWGIHCGDGHVTLRRCEVNTKAYAVRLYASSRAHLEDVALTSVQPGDNDLRGQGIAVRSKVIYIGLFGVAEGRGPAVLRPRACHEVPSTRAEVRGGDRECCFHCRRSRSARPCAARFRASSSAPSCLTRR